MNQIKISKRIQYVFQNLSLLNANPYTITQLSSLITTDDIFIKTALINAYGKFGDIESAKNIFDAINSNDKDVVSVVQLKALIHNGHNKQVLNIYKRFAEIQNDVMHLLAMQACININDENQGQHIYHNILSKHGSIDSLDLKLKTTLMDFYGHFGNIDQAKLLFDSIPSENKNVVCINTMMKTFVNNGYDNDALQLYDEYFLFHDNVTHLFAIKACINTDDFDKGNKIQERINQNKILNGNKMSKDEIELKTTLITFYGHFHDIELSVKIFNSIKNDIKPL